MFLIFVSIVLSDFFNSFSFFSESMPRTPPCGTLFLHSATLRQVSPNSGMDLLNQHRTSPGGPPGDVRWPYLACPADYRKAIWGKGLIPRGVVTRSPQNLGRQSGTPPCRDLCRLLSLTFCLQRSRQGGVPDCFLPGRARHDTPGYQTLSPVRFSVIDRTRQVRLEHVPRRTACRVGVEGEGGGSLLEHLFWEDADLRVLVARLVPEYLGVFDAYRSP